MQTNKLSGITKAFGVPVSSPAQNCADVVKLSEVTKVVKDYFENLSETLPLSPEVPKGLIRKIQSLNIPAGVLTNLWAITFTAAIGSLTSVLKTKNVALYAVLMANAYAGEMARC